MANLPWFKFFGSDYISDQKILELSAAERSCWITLLSYASQNDGYVKHLSEHKLMTQAGVDFMKDEWNETVGVLNHFQELEMIRVDNGMITILNWGKRQERAMTPYERVKKHRAKITPDNELITKRNANDNPRVDKSREDKNRKDIHTAFDKFWSLFPKKVAKKQAEKAWRKIPPSEHPAIYADVSRRRTSEDWTKKGGQFIPYPATYLNAERWKDEAAPEINTQKVFCVSCRKDATGNWIQAGGGKVCNDCFTGAGKENKKYQDMKGRTPVKGFQ